MASRPATSRQSSVSSVSSQPAAAVPARRSPSPTEQLQRLRLAESVSRTITGGGGGAADTERPIVQYQVPRDGDGYLDVSVSCCSSPWNIYVSHTNSLTHTELASHSPNSA